MKRLILEDKIQKAITIGKEVIKIDEQYTQELNTLEKALFQRFGEDTNCYSGFEAVEFIAKDKYIKEKCGDDPLEKTSNVFKEPPQKQQIPIVAILGRVICLIGIILTIIGFINMWSKNSDTPIFQGLLAIVGFIVLKMASSDYKAKKEEYNKKYNLYINEKLSNEKLKKEHEDWIKKVDNANKTYEMDKDEFIKNQKNLEKEYKKVKEDFEKKEFKLMEKHFTDNWREKNNELDVLLRDILNTIRKTEEKIPSSKKYGFDIFDSDLDFSWLEEQGDFASLSENLVVSVNMYLREDEEIGPQSYVINVLLPSILVYLNKDDIKNALLKYYKAEHDDEMEKEQLRLEYERNEIERERINAYERQEEINRQQQERFEREQEENQRQMEYERRQQEKQAEKDRQALAKQEADWAAARIRCAQCRLYNTCCSMSKNKKPYAPCFKPKN